MAKKLRLLYTQDCNRQCEGCCNKDWNLNSLEKVSHFNYDEILITGGEPMLYHKQLIGFIMALKLISPARIYIYTAWNVLLHLNRVLDYADGITITFHRQKDADLFKKTYSPEHHYNLSNKDKSLRLNVFKGIDISELDLTNWTIKDNMAWVKDCPLPNDEEFKTI